MKIAEYKLHGHPAGKGQVTPGFIQNGGYYSNPDDHTMLGFVDDPAEYYLPDTLVYYTLAEAKTRQLAIHANYPMHKIAVDGGSNEVMTDAEVEAQMDEWHTSHNS
jgi:hypothetical protein